MSERGDFVPGRNWLGLLFCLSYSDFYSFSVPGRNAMKNGPRRGGNAGQGRGCLASMRENGRSAVRARSALPSLSQVRLLIRRTCCSVVHRHSTIAFIAAEIKSAVCKNRLVICKSLLFVAVMCCWTGGQHFARGETSRFLPTKMEPWRRLGVTAGVRVWAEMYMIAQKHNRR